MGEFLAELVKPIKHFAVKHFATKLQNVRSFKSSKTLSNRVDDVGRPFREYDFCQPKSLDKTWAMLADKKSHGVEETSEAGTRSPVPSDWDSLSTFPKR